MSEQWTLTIPKGDLPWINSNDRKHYLVKARRTAAWKARTIGLTPCGGPGLPLAGRQHVVVTIHKARPGRWDVGNLYPTAKACLDAIVACGVLVDDDNTHVVGPDMRAGEKRAQACVVITIEPAA